MRFQKASWSTWGSSGMAKRSVISFSLYVREFHHFCSRRQKGHVVKFLNKYIEDNGALCVLEEVKIDCPLCYNEGVVGIFYSQCIKYIITLLLVSDPLFVTYIHFVGV